jgi:hypothetical protein
VQQALLIEIASDGTTVSVLRSTYHYYAYFIQKQKHVINCVFAGFVMKLLKHSSVRDIPNIDILSET